MDGDGKILSKANLRFKREDISYYLNAQGGRDDLSVAIEASYSWLYYYRFLRILQLILQVAYLLKTRICLLYTSDAADE